MNSKLLAFIKAFSYLVFKCLEHLFCGLHIKIIYLDKAPLVLCLEVDLDLEIRRADLKEEHLPLTAE